jgi:hypothetical protein
MEITLRIQAPELTAALFALANATEKHLSNGAMAMDALDHHNNPQPLPTHLSPNSSADPAETDKPKRNRSSSNPEADPELATQSDTEASASVPTIVELRAKAQEKGTAKGKDAIKSLLSEFGYESISTIPEEKRADFLTALEAL